MTQPGTAAIQDHFSQLMDPKVERTKHHPLVNAVTIVICAVICGAETWVEIEMYGKSK